MNTLSFCIYQASEPVYQQLVDLGSRKILIRKDDVRVGYDGRVVWYSGDPSSDLLFDKKDAFQYKHYFFVALPFLLADNGVDHTYIGEKRIGGEVYDALEVNFQDQPEFASLQNFLVLLDTATHQMTWLLKRTNTEADNDLYSARLYKNWQWVNGLLLPLHCEKYDWQNESLSEIQEGWEYLDVRIEMLPSDQSMFLRPADGQVLD